jgi:hypothetical protein
MAFTEDLSIFLADFGVSCTAGAVTALGILDMPGQVISDGMVLTTDYTLTMTTKRETILAAIGAVGPAGKPGDCG